MTEGPCFSERRLAQNAPPMEYAPARAVMKDVYNLADLENWSTETPPIRLGLFGDPVAHSLSPQMQTAALEHCALEMKYGRFQIGRDELEAALRLLPAL